MVQPRYASTVVLVRANDHDGFEVLLTRRPPEMRFLGGFYVFPGGTVHRNDYSPEMLARCRGLSGAQAQQILGSRHAPDEALGHWVAVMRELFEEVGILLCVTDTGDEIDLSDREWTQRIEVKRRSVVNKQLDFGSFLESENLFCDLSRVAYFDHWVTPDIYSMRFDTRFYVATLPMHQTPLERSEEVTTVFGSLQKTPWRDWIDNFFRSCRRPQRCCRTWLDSIHGSACAPNSNLVDLLG
jgi:8-oxo-dGTP pyrophosphatase MutT (NUDIX family)